MRIDALTKVARLLAIFVSSIFLSSYAFADCAIDLQSRYCDTAGRNSREVLGWTPILNPDFVPASIDTSRHVTDGREVRFQYSSSSAFPHDTRLQQGAFAVPIELLAEQETVTIEFIVVPGNNERVYHMFSILGPTAELLPLRNDPAIVLPSSGVGFLIGRSGSEYENSSLSVFNFRGGDVIFYEDDPAELTYRSNLKVQLRAGEPIAFKITMDSSGSWKVRYASNDYSEEVTGNGLEIDWPPKMLAVSGVEAGLTYYGDSTEIVVFSGFKIW